MSTFNGDDRICTNSEEINLLEDGLSSYSVQSVWCICLKLVPRHYIKLIINTKSECFHKLNEFFSSMYYTTLDRVSQPSLLLRQYFFDVLFLSVDNAEVHNLLFPELARCCFFYRPQPRLYNEYILHKTIFNWT